MPKTERLVITIWQPDKAALERMAQAEGEPVAVIARRIIRWAVREFVAVNGAGELQPAERGSAPTMTIFAEKVEVHVQQFNQTVNQNGGVNLNAGGNAEIDGDVAGRDKTEVKKADN
jgi:hypothetical protein